MVTARMAPLVLMILGGPFIAMAQQQTFLQTLAMTLNISPACAAGVMNVQPGSELAKQVDLFSGRPREALQVLVPMLLNDIKGTKQESKGIGKFLFRPQPWSRGVPDSCLYLPGMDFCNIDIFKRRVSWGVCVPAGCNEADVKSAAFPSPLFDELSKEWVEVVCTSAAKARGLPTSGTWVCMAVVLSLLAVELLCMWLLHKPTEVEGGQPPPRFGTAAASYLVGSFTAGRERVQSFLFSSDPNSPINWKKVLACFSLSESWRELTSPPPPGHFRCLDAIRTLSFLWIVLGHVFFFVVFGINFSNQRDAFYFYGRGFMSTVPGIITAGFTLAVDSFLFMSAFLAILSTFRTLKVKGQDTMSFIKGIPKEYLRRYLRLTPAYAMALYTFMFVAPMMVDGVRRPQFMWWCTNCRKRVWQNFLYINNLLSDEPYPMCYPVSWFLALLFQFQLVGPWVGLLAAKAPPRVTITFLLSLCVLSWVYSALLVERRGLRIGFMDSRVGVGRWTNEWYTKPWTRAPSYLLGSIFGIAWYYHSKQIKSRLDHSRYLPLGTLVFSLVCMGLALFGSYDETARSVPGLWSPLQRQFYMTLANSVWSVGFGALLTLLFTGPTFGIRKLLEHPLWSFYGRLAYGTFLLHSAVVFIITGSQSEPWHWTTFILLVFFCGVTAVTLAAAVPLYLLVERPFTALSDLLLRDAGPARKEKKKTDDEMMMAVGGGEEPGAQVAGMATEGEEEEVKEEIVDVEAVVQRGQ